MMPQLDITLNLVWFFSLIVLLGALYINNVYIYIPLLLRCWKFRTSYPLSMELFALHVYGMYSKFINTSSYEVVLCTQVSSSFILSLKEGRIGGYELDVPEYVEISSRGVV